MSDTATIEETAVLDFAPWSTEEPSEDLFTPPSNAEWTDLGRRELPYIRMAFGLMFKTKAELVDIFAKDPDLMMRLADDLKSSAETFENIGRIQSLLEAAQLRLIVAGAALAMQEAAQ